MKWFVIYTEKGDNYVDDGWIECDSYEEAKELSDRTWVDKKLVCDPVEFLKEQMKEIQSYDFSNEMKENWLILLGMLINQLEGSD